MDFFLQGWYKIIQSGYLEVEDGFEEEEAMKCVICKYGETAPGKVTVTLDQDGATIVIREVPALVCQTCGEEYVDEEVAARLLRIAEEASQAGVQVDIRKYIAA
jgi:YgiT-type zinc finger domain-containing protein